MGKKLENPRGDEFTRLVALELKGKVASQEWTMTQLSEATGHAPATLSNWFTNRRPLPLGVALTICETIDASLTEIVERAYKRLAPPDASYSTADTYVRDYSEAAHHRNTE